MAEQISRRANNVTSAQFEAPFETQIVRFGVGGLNLKDSLDVMEGWSRLTNIWHEHEGEATVRQGERQYALTGAGATCHSLRKLRNPRTGTHTRFYGVGTTVRQGPWDPDPLHAPTTPTTVSSGYSGDPLTFVPHRPPLSGDPWMFIADRTKMAKVRADGLALPIGLPAPSSMATSALGHEYRRAIAMCDSSDDTEAANWTPIAGKDENGNAADTPDAAVAPAGAPFGDGIYCVTNPGSVISAYDSWWGCHTNKDLTVLDEVGGSGTTPASDNDIIHVWMKLSHPHLIEELRIYIVCSDEFDPGFLPGTPGGATSAPTANTDAYVKAFRANDYVQFVLAAQSQVEAAEQARIYALRDKDAKDRAYQDARTSWNTRKAETDPGRAPSFQLGLGAHQWFSYGDIGSSLRRGDFQRIGSTPDRDWSTVTGVILYVKTRITTEDRAVGVAMDDLYITGGFGPDTVEPGAQQYDYRITNYDPRTGCESNGSDEMDDVRVDSTVQETAPIDTMRRQITVTPVAYGDAAIRQRFYRRGGALIDDWYYLGENDADGAVFVDRLTDDEIVGAGTLPIDHYQPVPTLDDSGATVLNQAVRALWGPLEGMLFACGDPHRPGHVYYCLPDTPDHWSATGNVEVCAPSEELMNGGIAGHQAFVFSRTKLYLLYPNLSGQTGVTAAPSLCTRGLIGYWSFCVGPGGVVYFVSEDGVFATQGGPEDWISEVINPLFYGFTVNGYEWIDKTHPEAIRLTVWENALYFQYQDRLGQRQVLVYSLLQKFWRHYHFAQPPACVQGDDEDLLLLGGLATGKVYTLYGPSDDGAAIPWLARTGAASGGRREEKLFGDLVLDADTQLTELDVQVFFNEEKHANTADHVTGPVGRARFLIGAFGVNPQKAHSISCEIRGSFDGSLSPDPMTLYQLGIAATMQPDLTNTRVTNWDDLNYSDETWVTGVTLDCDTGGQPKGILIEGDFNGTRFLIASFTVTSSNRHKLKFSWPAVSANMVRIRPDPADCVPWLLYRADWIYVEEPPRISKWDIHFENSWDQYYTGLDLYCDTAGSEKRIEVYVDEVRLVNQLAGGLTYWPVQTSGRQVVHLTLPWGRGHVFRFKAIDDNPGLLYTHRWHLQEEPSEQANWNQNFSTLGTHADKWLKAIIFECDTFGQDKTVSVEVDGSTVETLTVNTTGRKVVQLALPTQHLGRVWRMFPTDAHPGRLYSAEPIFDEEPFQLDRWETQETNHGLAGWFYPLYGHVTLKSTADVTLRTVVQHNQTGGQTTHDYVIPSTGGQKQRRFLQGFVAGKGVLIKYILTSAIPFWLYRDETVIVIQPWGAYQSITVQPFGNDDQDPARPMTHAVLAAQASTFGARSQVSNPGVGG